MLSRNQRKRRNAQNSWQIWTDRDAAGLYFKFSIVNKAFNISVHAHLYVLSGNVALKSRPPHQPPPESSDNLMGAYMEVC